ncbi:hypothetical protein DFJ73DRAFT_235070 [Zopfochytrium polystomum]|nr:hypothetical protein DFJ73DRAFT_235070 [Zopfochytrium polystomum]
MPLLTALPTLPAPPAPPPPPPQQQQQQQQGQHQQQQHQQASSGILFSSSPSSSLSTLLPSMLSSSSSSEQLLLQPSKPAADSRSIVEQYTQSSSPSLPLQKFLLPPSSSAPSSSSSSSSSSSLLGLLPFRHASCPSPSFGHSQALLPQQNSQPQPQPQPHQQPTQLQQHGMDPPSALHAASPSPNNNDSIATAFNAARILGASPAVGFSTDAFGLHQLHLHNQQNYLQPQTFLQSSQYSSNASDSSLSWLSPGPAHSTEPFQMPMLPNTFHESMDLYDMLQLEMNNPTLSMLGTSPQATTVLTAEPLSEDIFGGLTDLSGASGSFADGRNQIRPIKRHTMSSPAAHQQSPKRHSSIPALKITGPDSPPSTELMRDRLAITNDSNLGNAKSRFLESAPSSPSSSSPNTNASPSGAYSLQPQNIYAPSATRSPLVSPTLFLDIPPDLISGAANSPAASSASRHSSTPVFSFSPANIVTGNGLLRSLDDGYLSPSVASPYSAGDSLPSPIAYRSPSPATAALLDLDHLHLSEAYLQATQHQQQQQMQHQFQQSHNDALFAPLHLQQALQRAAKDENSNFLAQTQQQPLGGHQPSHLAVPPMPRSPLLGHSVSGSLLNHHIWSTHGFPAQSTLSQPDFPVNNSLHPGGAALSALAPPSSLGSISPQALSSRSPSPVPPALAFQTETTNATSERNGTVQETVESKDSAIEAAGNSATQSAQQQDPQAQPSAQRKPPRRRPSRRLSTASTSASKEKDSGSPSSAPNTPASMASAAITTTASPSGVGASRPRPHRCTHCTKTFLRKQDVIRHRATHLPRDLRPFHCPNTGCDRRYGRIDAVLRHARLFCTSRKLSGAAAGSGGDGSGGGDPLPPGVPSDVSLEDVLRCAGEVGAWVVTGVGGISVDAVGAAVGERLAAEVAGGKPSAEGGGGDGDGDGDGEGGEDEDAEADDDEGMGGGDVGRDVAAGAAEAFDGMSE